MPSLCSSGPRLSPGVERSASSSVSTVVNRRFVEHLPLNGRSFQQLTLLVPGAVTPNPQGMTTPQPNTGSGRPFVNGNREQGNAFLLDGIRELAKGRVTFSEDASAPVPERAVGVVVVGETPYAEGFGDVGGPQWAYDPGDNNVPRPKKEMLLSEADQLAIRRVC